MFHQNTALQKNDEKPCFRLLLLSAKMNRTANDPDSSLGHASSGACKNAREEEAIHLKGSLAGGVLNMDALKKHQGTNSEAASRLQISDAWLIPQHFVH